MYPDDIIHDSGKFEGEWVIARDIYDLIMDGEENDWLVVEGTFYYVIIFDNDLKAELISKYKDRPNVIKQIAKLYAAIAWTTESGFFHVAWYDSKREFNRAYRYLTREGEKEAEEEVW